MNIVRDVLCWSCIVQGIGLEGLNGPFSSKILSVYVRSGRGTEKQRHIEHLNKPNRYFLYCFMEEKEKREIIDHIIDVKNGDQITYIEKEIQELFINVLSWFYKKKSILERELGEYLKDILNPSLHQKLRPQNLYMQQ